MKQPLLLISLLLATGGAHAVSPRLTNLTPAGAQRGTEVEVRFTGQRLDDTKEIVLYTPGLSIVKMEEPKTNVVNVLNGLLDIETRTLAPHSADFLSAMQLPVKFDPQAAEKPNIFRVRFV